MKDEYNDEALTGPEPEETPKKKRGNLNKRPYLHSKPMKRYYGVDDFRLRDHSGRPHNNKKAVYATDRECIEAGDICASPALFES